jgi:histidyl-tRNA synthetase
MVAIEPRTLKGFRDLTPALAIARERMVDTVKDVYRSYGFSPIDTPALEYAEVLLGKLDPDAEVQRQIYRFTDHGGRDVALRFDLTVPFARFAAQHIGELGTPFKRYHVGTAWRGENTQAGRYREFMQCDFDTIGTTSNLADADVVCVVHDLLVALGFERFRIRVSNRLVLSGVLDVLGVGEHAGGVLRAVDKLAKQGPDAVHAELVDKVGLDGEQSAAVLDLVASDLDAVEKAFGHNERVADGIARLREVLAVAAATGVPESRLQVDLSISRGLDYYTGTVLETFLDDVPAIGSVCSGGRYDDLAGLYTKQALPGVGASLGLDRLLAAMEELGLVPTAVTPAPVFVARFPGAPVAGLAAIAADLRRAGIGTELFPDAKKLGQQLAYAERRGFRVAVMAGPAEIEAGTVKVKDLAARTEAVVARDAVADEVRRILGG